MKLRFAIVSVVTILVITPRADAQSQSTSERKVSIRHQDRQRTAAIYVPPSYIKSKPAPLILVFHGGGGNAENAERTVQMHSHADKHGFIVAYPTGTGVLPGALLTWNAWNCCGYARDNNVDDVGFVRELIETLKQRYAIDAKRIYATGLSNGAMLSYRLACEASEHFAAIATVAGALNTDSCRPREPVSVVIFHGTEDQHVLFVGGTNRKRFPGSAPRNDRPVQHAFDTWARTNRCQPQTPVQFAASVQKTACVNGSDGAEVVLYAIEGQGHAWPGGKPGLRNGNVDPPSQQISATETMVEFFLRHAKR